jgi:hypothetical protein
MKQPSFTVFIASLVIALTLVVCKKPDSGLGDSGSKDTSLSAVVVFSVGDSRISHSDGTEERAQLGASVKTGDTIVTGDKGKVDLQFNNGSSIRISPATTLDFAKIAYNSNGSTDTQISLASGKVFANVNKAKKDDSFSVVTPTAIAGVRGTSFIVENDAKLNKAKVKVVDGSVAMAPRIPALENATQEQIEASEGLKSLQASIQKVEVILEKGQETTLVSNSQKLADAEIDTLDVAKLTQVVEKEKPVVTVSSITKSEEQEIKTIVTVDEKTVQAISQLNSEGAATEDAAKLAEIEKKKKEIEEQLAVKQEEKENQFKAALAEKPKEFNTKKDIVNYYERIEKVVLTNGKIEVGAIINQENNMMIIHTEQGVKKINLGDVQEVIYDYQSKTKF